MVDASSSAKIQGELNRGAFDRLLGWLDQDRDRAADKYEEIRIRLIKVFETRGCENCEDLTDDTIDRVASRVHEISGTYEGNPALYFHGVARLVYLEYLRKRPKPMQATLADAGQEIEQRYNCLEDCLNRLSTRNRELILQYYEDESRIAGDPRKEIAARLGISPNAVRIRAHRIRESLSRCVRNCLTLNDGSVKASQTPD